MRESEAKEILNTLLVTLVRFRGVNHEILQGGYSKETVEETLAIIQPWISGEKSIIPALNKMLEKETLEPMDFYNMMTICTVLEPTISTIYHLAIGKRLPDASLSIVSEWQAGI